MLVSINVLIFLTNYLINSYVICVNTSTNLSASTTLLSVPWRRNFIPQNRDVHLANRTQPFSHKSFAFFNRRVYSKKDLLSQILNYGNQRNISGISTQITDNAQSRKVASSEISKKLYVNSSNIFYSNDNIRKTTISALFATTSILNVTSQKRNDSNLIYRKIILTTIQPKHNWNSSVLEKGRIIPGRFNHREAESKRETGCIFLFVKYFYEILLKVSSTR